MDITPVDHVDYLELKLAGRFDAAWSEHVSSAIESAVRAGSHRIALNFAGVVYISSLGIRVLLKHYNTLKAVKGTLSIIEPTDAARTILKTAGLAPFLLDRTPPAGTVAAAAPPATATVIDTPGATYELFAQHAGASLEAAWLGRPAAFLEGGFAEADCRPLDLPAGTMAVGLGGFGEGFADCRDRFGEFLAVGGAAIALPTAEQGVPDFVVTEGNLVPRVQALYAVQVTGAFASMLRFDAKADTGGMITLNDLITQALDLAQARAIGVAILAEAAGVVGASLRRSPASARSGDAPLGFPGVRDWLSFTTERSQERNLVLITGVAVRTPRADEAAFVRPLAPGSDIHAHLHGAIFPYRPVQRGSLPLDKSVADLLASALPRTVMHLLADTRTFEGVGQTDVMRGACWFGPLTSRPEARHA